MGLGEGGRKRVAAMWYLVGLPSYQNLTKLVEEILARGLGEIRKASKTETFTLPQWPAADASPAGSAHLARHAERSDRYQQLIELRKAGLTDPRDRTPAGHGRTDRASSSSPVVFPLGNLSFATNAAVILISLLIT